MLTFPVTLFGGGPARIDFASNTSDSTDATSYSFSMGAGTVTDDRYIIVGVSVVALGADTTTLPTVTINGNATTAITTDAFLKFVGLSVPAVTSITVGITRGGNQMSSASAVVYAAYNLTSTTAAATVSTGGGGNPQVGSVNTNLGDCIVGMGFSNGAASFTWSGLTEDVDSSPAGVLSHTSAHQNAVASGTPYVVDVTRSAGAVGGIITASFR